MKLIVGSRHIQPIFGFRPYDKTFGFTPNANGGTYRIGPLALMIWRPIPAEVEVRGQLLEAQAQLADLQSHANEVMRVATVYEKGLRALRDALAGDQLSGLADSHLAEHHESGTMLDRARRKGSNSARGMIIRQSAARERKEALAAAGWQ